MKCFVCLIGIHNRWEFLSHKDHPVSFAGNYTEATAASGMQPLIARLCSPTIKSQPTPHPLPPPSWNKKSVDTDCLQEHDCVLRQKAVLLLQQVFVSEAKQRKRQGNFLRNVLLPYQAKLNGFSCLKKIIILFLRRSCNVLQCSGLKVTLGSEIGMRRGEMCACMCAHLLCALVTVAA